MPLRPLSFPVPETRFLHAGSLVYKLRIRYGHCSSAPDASLAASAAKEVEEVIRVVLGNLEDLQPFSTDHFTVFPYLSKWERVSKMKFKHENVNLVPYPYMCTLYLELNCCQQNVSRGKGTDRGSDEPVRRRKVMSEGTAMEEAVKRRRVEVEAEISCPQSLMDRTGADPVQQRRKAELGFEKNSSQANECEFIPASLPQACDQMSCWKSGLCAPEQGRAAPQAEGTAQLLQQMAQTGEAEHGKSEGRGLSRFWRSVIITPLRYLFGGKN